MDLSLLITTSRGLVIPFASPDQLSNSYSCDGKAVKTTLLPSLKVPELGTTSPASAGETFTASEYSFVQLTVVNAHKKNTNIIRLT